MDYLNPIAPSVLQTPVAQKQAAATKGQQIRRVQQSRRFTATQADLAEQPVESAEEITPVRRDQAEEERRRQPRRQGYSSDGQLTEDEPAAGLDLTG